MPQIRIRITGSDDASRAIRDLLTSLPEIERVEDVQDLMPHMDDPDSSSAGLSEDQGPGMRVLDVGAPDDAAAERVREAVEALAFKLDVLAEFESSESGVGE